MCYCVLLCVCVCVCVFVESKLNKELFHIIEIAYSSEKKGKYDRKIFVCLSILYLLILKGTSWSCSADKMEKVWNEEAHKQRKTIFLGEN